LDVETGSYRTLKAAGEPIETLLDYMKREFLQTTETVSSWRIAQGPLPVAGASFDVAASAVHLWSQRVAFLIARPRDHQACFTSTGELGISKLEGHITKVLAQDPTWSHEVRWSPLGTRLAVAETLGPEN